MDELFTRYMYYVRATRGLSDTTTIALRKFYENDNYALMYKNETLDNLETLLDFWNDVTNQDVERFSIRVLRRLFVLSYAPNGMWRYFTSVYFMKNKDAEGKLDDELFYNFLNTITAFIWAYSVFKPGVNSLRTPVYAEMLKIIEGKPVDFNPFVGRKAGEKSYAVFLIFNPRIDMKLCENLFFTAELDWVFRNSVYKYQNNVKARYSDFKLSLSYRLQ